MLHIVLHGHVDVSQSISPFNAIEVKKFTFS